MAAEHVERIREVYASWSRGDFGADVELFADDCLFTTFDADGDEIALHGVEAFRDWFRGFLQQWQQFRQEAKEILTSGESVLVAGVQYAKGQASGAELAMPVYNVWVFREGRVVEFHVTRHEAVAHAKLNAR